MSKFKIPKPIAPPSTNNFDTTEKCKSCAYRNPPTVEDIECTKMMYHEHPCPHPCHEKKNGTVCFGSMEDFEKHTPWRRPESESGEVSP